MVISVPGHRLDGDERRQRDHRVGRPAADIDVADVGGLSAVVGLGLDVDAVEPPEAVEVVHVGAAHRRRHGLEDLVHGHAERARLFPVELDLHLGIRGIERGEEGGELGPLASRRQEGARLGAELVHAQGAAPILKKEVEARRSAEAGDGGNVEGKGDRFRDLRELALQGGHEALHVQRLALPLFPRLEAHEDGPEVRLIGVGDDAVAADRLVRLDALQLREDLFDLAQHGARPLERGGRRQLHVDAEDALVLLGDEAGRQGPPEQADSDHHDPHEQDREYRAPHEQSGHADVAVGRRARTPC